ncbi:hypothetical protein [Thorsellia anophelis]|uniref:Uncharacterized protein n=1 Tax=Thorsellia anophelis DSM 18579 TaxID=1123402 RepID=A0A1I0CWP9_9GAMM|nr:hypothetical protein [Thorsellia anophelis]SET24182.1 hypothetical protein SAMN02583745_01779 [Thorsellia anophelis DSM 18579]
MLKSPKRIDYAYDERQNLSGTSLPPPEEIFGNDNSKSLITFENDRRREFILQKYYRNSRPVLITAQSLGFGIYIDIPQNNGTGLVQMFD